MISCVPSLISKPPVSFLCFVCLFLSTYHLAVLNLVAHRLSNCGARVQLAHGMWNPSSWIRDQTRAACIRRWTLNHWTTREVPSSLLFSWIENVSVKRPQL